MTRLGYFWKNLAANLLTKLAKLSGDFLGCFEKHQYLIHKWIVYFLGQLWVKIGHFLVYHLVTLVASLWSCRRKSFSITGLQFNTIGFDRTRKKLLFVWTETTEAKPVKLETSCSVTSPLRWVFSGLTIALTVIFLKKWANPGLFFVYFRLFKQTLQLLQQINVKKCPSSIRHRDSNSQPSDYESPPLTTRPKLPPKIRYPCLEYSIFALRVSSELWSLSLFDTLCFIWGENFLANGNEIRTHNF